MATEIPDAVQEALGAPNTNSPWSSTGDRLWAALAVVLLSPDERIAVLKAAVGADWASVQWFASSDEASAEDFRTLFGFEGSNLVRGAVKVNLKQHKQGQSPAERRCLATACCCSRFWHLTPMLLPLAQPLPLPLVSLVAEWGVRFACCRGGRCAAAFCLCESWGPPCPHT